jgi:hypothetical protein
MTSTMPAILQSTPIEQLTFYTPAQQPMTLEMVLLKTVTPEKDMLQESSLTFSVTAELYQHLRTEQLFHMTSDACGTSASVELLPDLPIQIELHLASSQLPDLRGMGLDVTAIAQRLVELECSHSLLNTESWFCHQVQQQQSSGKVSFRTLWAYTSPEQVELLQSSAAEVTQALSSFFQELGQVAQTTIKRELPDFRQRLEELVNEVSNLSSNSLSEVIQSFFKDEEWAYDQVDDSTLRLIFQADQGEWDCWVEWHEEEQQVVFYSLYPLAIPAERRVAMMEFMTRANYGLRIGNFELDLEDGELRYKTSLDVEGDRLTSALLNQLVYTNVLTLNTYFPGITAVLQDTLSPVAAIAQIEETDHHA